MPPPASSSTHLASNLCYDRRPFPSSPCITPAPKTDRSRLCLIEWVTGCSGATPFVGLVGYCLAAPDCVRVAIGLQSVCRRDRAHRAMSGSVLRITKSKIIFALHGFYRATIWIMKWKWKRTQTGDQVARGHVTAWDKTRVTGREPKGYDDRRNSWKNTFYLILLYQLWIYVATRHALT